LSEFVVTHAGGEDDGELGFSFLEGGPVAAGGDAAERGGDGMFSALPAPVSEANPRRLIAASDKSVIDLFPAAVEFPWELPGFVMWCVAEVTDGDSHFELLPPWFDGWLAVDDDVAVDELECFARQSDDSLNECFAGGGGILEDNGLPAAWGAEVIGVFKDEKLITVTVGYSLDIDTALTAVGAGGESAKSFRLTDSAFTVVDRGIEGNAEGEHAAAGGAFDAAMKPTQLGGHGTCGNQVTFEDECAKQEYSENEGYGEI
jgi:hypothetical protein